MCIHLVYFFFYFPVLAEKQHCYKGDREEPLHLAAIKSWFQTPHDRLAHLFPTGQQLRESLLDVLPALAMRGLM